MRRRLTVFLLGLGLFWAAGMGVASCKPVAGDLGLSGAPTPLSSPSGTSANLPARASPSAAGSFSATETATILPSPTATMTPTEAVRLWLPSYLPRGFSSRVRFPENVGPVEDEEAADLRLEVGGGAALSRWIYALAAPFPTAKTETTSAEVRQHWQGESEGLFAGQPLLLDAETLALFSAWWGEPAEGRVQVLPAEELLDYAWQHRPSWALIPFEAIEPRWKVLRVDGQSPLQAEFEASAYALAAPFGLFSSEGAAVTNLPPGWELPASNRDRSRLTVVALTGVTALVRGTAVWMENYGITYPAEEIGPVLRAADITHISNEIPFAPACPYPEVYQTELIFCSRPSYLALLEAVGADVIELTGDHFGDWGAEAMLYTLGLYRERGWPFYGGGENAEQARSPLLLEHNGNRLAFVGCNIGCKIKNEVPCHEYATAERPGAATCDFEWLEKTIPELRDEGYQVIFTFQHKEYYTYKIEPDLRRDFGRIAAAGAVVVSGSQAHQPHGMAFENGAFIHYGLGNLFFDQYHFCADYACDNGFIDRHVFYDGRYLGVEAIPIRFVDPAKPRLMTPEEAESFLRIIFSFSGW